jgi:hypothetical protein
MIGTSVKIFAENLFHPIIHYSDEQAVSTNFYLPAPEMPGPAVTPLAAPPGDGHTVYYTGNDAVASTGCYDWLYPGKIEGSATVCEGGTAPAMGSGAGNEPASLGNGAITYQWYVNKNGAGVSSITGATAVTYAAASAITNASGTYVFTRKAIDNLQQEGMAEGSYTLVVLDRPTVSISSASATESICYNTPAHAMTATPYGGTGASTYTWQKKEGTGNWITISGVTGDTYDPGALTVTTQYQVMITQSASSCASAYSSPVTKTVYTLFNPGIVNSSGGTICAGGTPAQISASTANGGAGAITYQWYKDGTLITDATSQNYTPPATDASSTGSVTYTRYAYNATCNPSGTTTATLSSGSYVLTVVSDPDVQITDGKSICYNDLPGTIASTVTGGVSNTYTYQWQSSPATSTTWSNVGANDNYTPSSLTNSTQYRLIVTQTASGCASTSMPSTVTVYPEFNPGTVTGSGSTICAGGTPAQISASTANGGSGAITYQWYKNGALITDGTSQNYTPPASDATATGAITYTRMAKSSACPEKTTSGNFVLTVINKPTVTITSAETVCVGTPVSAMTATPSGGVPDSGVTYMWRWGTTSDCNVGSTTTSVPTYSVSTLTAGSHYYTVIVTQGTSGCASSSATPILKKVLTPPAQPVAPDQTVCGAGNSVGVPLSASCPACNNVSFEWWSVATGGTRLSTNANYTVYVPAGTSATYYVNTVMNDAPKCVSARVPVVAIVFEIHTTPQVQGASTCANTGVSLRLQATNAATLDADEEFIWYNSGGQPITIGVSGAKNQYFDTPATLTPNVYTYYVGIHNKTYGCTTNIANRVPVTATINAIPLAPVALSNQACADPASSSTQVQLAGTTTESNKAYKWHTQSSGESFISAGASYTATVTNPTGGNTTASATYYVEAYDLTTNCVSPRTPVTAYVNANPVAPSTITVSDVCDGAELIFTISGGQASTYSYDWTGSSVDGVPVGNNRYAYKYAKSQGNAPGTYTVKVKSSTTYTNGTLATNTCYSVTELSRNGVIYALPVAPTAITTIPADGLICSNGTITFNATLASSNYGYEWLSPTPGISPSTSQSYVVGGAPAYSGATLTPSVRATEIHSASLVCKSEVYTGTPVLVGTTPARPVLTAVTSRADTSVCAATTPSIILEVSNAGTPGVTYRWYKDGSSSSLTGETASTYAATATGTYTAEAVHGHCVSTQKSQPRFVRITPATDVPGNVELNISAGTYQHGCGEGSVQLSVKTPSSTLTSYQWYKNGIAISGATNPTFSVKDLEQATYTVAGIYYACTGAQSTDKIVVNLAESTLKGRKATITGPPMRRSCDADVLLSCTTIPDAVLYAWYRNDNEIVGSRSTATTYSVHDDEYGVYTVKGVAANSCTSDASDPVTVMILKTPAKAVLDVTPLTLCQESLPYSLSVPSVAHAAEYWWYVDGTSAATTTLPEYEIPQSAATGSHSYTVQTANTNGIVLPCAGPVSDAKPVTIMPVITISTSRETYTAVSGREIRPIELTPGFSTALGGTVTYNWTVIAATFPTAALEATGVQSGTATPISGMTFTFKDPESTAVYPVQISVWATYVLNGVSCAGVKTITINVQAKPDHEAVSEVQTICNGAAIESIKIHSAEPAHHYNWVRTAPSGITTNINSEGSIGDITVGSISGSASNTTGSPQTINFTFTPYTDATTPDPAGTFSAVVIVLPDITGEVVGNDTIEVCTDVRFTFTVAGAPSLDPAKMAFEWVRPATAISPAATGTVTNVSDSLSNTTGEAIMVKYDITPIYIITAGDSCKGKPFSAWVKVNSGSTALPRVTDTTICTGYAVMLIVQNNEHTPGAALSWALSGANITANLTSGTVLPVSVQLTNTGNAPATATFTVTPALGSCPGTPGSVTVVVNPPLTATATATPVTCYGGNDGAITITTTLSGVTYTLKQGNDVLAQQTTPVFNNLRAGVYSVELSNGTSCSGNLSVTVNTPAKALNGQVFILNTVTCSSLGRALVVVDYGTNQGACTYTLGAETNITGLFENLAQGAYTVTINDSKCTAAIPFVIGGSTATPTVTLAAVNDVTCIGGSDGELVVTTQGGSPAFSTYILKWNGSDYRTYNVADLLQNRIITGLPAGSYTVAVSDGNCTSTVSNEAVIGAPAALAATYTAVAPSACNVNDGSATITITQDNINAPYYFELLDGRKQPSTPTVKRGEAYTVTGLSAGVPVIHIVDSKGCRVQVTPDVQIPTANKTLKASIISPASVTCYGGSNGSFTINITGGTPPVSYKSYDYTADGATWKTVQQTPDTKNTFENLSAGTYRVHLSDAANCNAIVEVLVKGPAAPLSATVKTTKVACYGGSATAQVFAAGGTVPYRFSWSQGASTASYRNDLAVGTYSVTVIDKNNCIIASPITFTIEGPANLLTLSNLSAGTSTCGGVAPVTFDISGGTAPYIIKVDDALLTDADHYIDGGGSGGIYKVAGVGLHKITVLDASNCEISGNVTIPSATNTLSVQLTGTPVDVTCTTLSAITLKVNGGQPFSGGKYEFQLNNNYPVKLAATTGDSYTINNVGAGVYEVKVRDAAGCEPVSALSPVTVNAASTNTLRINAVATQTVNCYQGIPTGEIQVTVLSGGKMPYTVVCKSTDGATFTYTKVVNAHMDTIKGLRAGYYAITIQDADGCAMKAANEVHVIQPDPITFTTLVSGITCFGDTNGEITVIGVQGGNTAKGYEYSKDNVVYQSSPVFKNLPSGLHRIYVRDLSSNHCTGFADVEISNVVQLTLVATVSKQPATENSNDGEITVTAQGGTAPYEYTKGNNFYQSSPVFQNIGVGNYSVSVRDLNGCTATVPAPVVVAPVAGGSLTIIADVTPVNCFGDNTGAISVKVTGGVGNYSYTLNAGDPNAWKTGSVFSGLQTGLYTVTVRDGDGVEKSIEVTVPTVPQIVINAEYKTGGGVNRIEGTAIGGSGVLFYSLNGQTWFNQLLFINPPAGENTIYVKDAVGCEATATIIIPNGQQDEEIAYAINVKPSSSCGTATIHITNITGGSGNYQYSTDNGTNWLPAAAVTTNVFTVPKAAGTYTIKLRDNGMPAKTSGTYEVVITVPADGINLNLSATNACYGEANAVIAALATGSTGLTYALDGGIFQTLNIFGGLSGGRSYTVSVRDAAGCVVSKSITVGEHAKINVTVVSVTNATAGTSADGVITVAATGGNDSFQYANGAQGVYQPTGTFNYLQKGAYTFFAKDGNGCFGSVPVTFAADSDVPPTLSVTANIIKELSCSNGNDAEVTVTAFGGTTPYAYSKDNFVTQQSIATFTSLAAGTYVFYVRDAATTKAQGNVTIVVNAPKPVVVVPVLTQALSSSTASDAIVTVTATGGKGNFTYAKDAGAFGATNVFNGLSTGLYTFKAKDANACEREAYINIGEPGTTDLTITATILEPLLCGQPAKVLLTATGGANNNYQYSFTASSITNSWMNSGSSYTVEVTAAGTYYAKATNAAGQQSNIVPVIITGVASNLAITASVTQPLVCYGTVDAEITITPSGSTGNTWYRINGGAWGTSPVFSNLSAGVYTLEAKDETGCVVVTQATVAGSTSALQLSATVSGTGVIANATGGTQPYQYAKSLAGGWQPSQPTQTSYTLTGFAEGTHYIYAKDHVGCIDSAKIVIADGTINTLSIGVQSITPVTCYGGSDGAVALNVSGGTAPYAISKDGVTWVSGTSLTGLLAGDYNFYVKDNAGNKASITLTVPQPEKLVIKGVTLVSVNNGKATVDVMVIGGTPVYYYSTDGLTFGTSARLTYDHSGLQTVYVRDRNNTGCVVTTTVSIPALPDEILVSAYVSKEITCESDADAEITVMASGGTPAYQYSKTGADGSWIVGNVLSGFDAGKHKVYVRDAKGKVAYTLVDVKQVVALRIAAVAQAPSAATATDGTVLVNVIEGRAPFEFSKFSNSGWQTGNVLTGFGVGVYTVYAKDVYCPPVSASGYITFTGGKLTASVSVWQHVTCFGANDGIINITAAGGVSGNYTFTINGSAETTFTNGNSHTITDLEPGTYTIIVKRDTDAIPIPIIAIINGPNQLNVTTSVTDVSCYGDASGIITANATGGAGNFHYSLNAVDWTPQNVFTDIAAGSRVVYVRDSKGCVVSTNVTINQQAPITFTANVTQVVSAENAKDGEVKIANVGGGIEPYTFSAGNSWSSSATLTGFAQGNFTVYVQDNNGCIASQNGYMPVAGSSDFDVIAYVSKPLTCAGDNNAEITLITTATGVGFSKDGQVYATNTTLTGFAAGIHTLYARYPNDAAGKVITLKVEVKAVAPVIIESIAVMPGISASVPTATLTITATGGRPPLQYKLDNGSAVASNVIANVAAGIHTVTVSNAGGTCPATATVNVAGAGIGTATNISISANVSKPLVCNNGNDAEISATATGGGGLYDYSLDGGASWIAASAGNHVFTGLLAGAYNVVARDANDIAKHSATITLTISNPADWTLTAAATAVQCTGSTTGEITLTATPAAGVLYSKDRQVWSANNKFNGLQAGIYTVFAKNGSGCIKEATATISQPANPLVITAQITKEFELPGGAEITAVANGGTPAYTYTISASSATRNYNKFSNVPEGNHIVTVTDANGCVAITTVPVADVPAGNGITSLSVQVTKHPLCYGAHSGEIKVTIIGGKAPYIYSNGLEQFTSNDLSHKFVQLAAGIYTINVTDVEGHSLSQTVALTAPAPLTVTAIGSNANLIVAEAQGGTPQYRYSMNDVVYQSSNVITGLTVGTYIVYAADANLCKAQTNSAIEVIDSSNPAEFGIKADITKPISCKDGQDAEVTVTVTDGTGTFVYANGNTANYQPSNIFTGLASGQYTFYAKNVASGKEKQVTITVNAPEALELKVLNVVPVSAAMATDGEITLQAAGGKQPYTYINANTGAEQSSFVFSGLTAGNYNLSVKDANGCVETIAVTLSVEGEGLSLSIQKQGNVSCYGGNDGWAEVYVAGGSGNYEYSLDNRTWQTSRRLEGLSAGRHTLYVKDYSTPVNYAQIVVDITQPAALVLSAEVTAPVNPQGSNTAAIKLSAQGGTPAYLYADVVKQWDVNDRLTNLAAGYHLVFVQDDHKCVDSLTVHIGDGPKALSLIADVTKPVTCFGGADAEITLTVANGKTPYLYSKDGQHWVTSKVLAGYTAGIYTVYAKDNNGATISTYVEVKQPAQISAVMVVTKAASAAGVADGEVKFIPAGGVAPYQYRNATSDTWQSEDTIAVAPGTYTFYVKDANGCQGTTSVSVGVVTGSGDVSFTAFVSAHPACVGTSGEITVIANGGNGTFRYSAITATAPSWTEATGANTYVFSALPAGTYNVTVNSGSSTATPIQLVINSVSVVTATATVSPASCYGTADGKVIITAGGGAGNYRYSKDGLDYTDNKEITGLTAGTYVLFVKDALGCQSLVTAHISQPERLTVTAEVTRNVTYAGGNNAEVTATATNGTPGTIGYHYSKNGLHWIYNGNVLTGYSAGLAKVYARDENNCIAEAAVYISDYKGYGKTPLTLVATVSKPLSCFGKSDAEITLKAQGGSGTYAYRQEGGTYGAVATLTGFPAGTHKVYVKDADGAEVYVTVTVQPVQPLTAYVQVTYNGATAVATVIAEGGVAPYGYKLDGNAVQNSNVFTPVAAGAHTITVSDANDCAAAPVYLNIGGNPNEVTLTASVTKPLVCADGAGAEITARVTGGAGPVYQYSRNNGVYQTGGHVFVYPNIGTGAHTFVAKDAKGVLSNQVIVPVTSNATATLSITAVVVTVNNCYGVNSAQVVIAATGGVPALQYSLNGVDYQLSGTFTNQQLSSGAHYVYVKDALGCVKEGSVVVPALPAQLQLQITAVTNPTAAGASDGVIVAEAAGGHPAYTYNNNNATSISGVFGNLIANTYTVKVIDAKNCEDAKTVVLGANPDELSLRVDTQNPKCYGDNSGLITVNVSGGTAPYSYSLDSINYQEGVNVFAGLTAGIYTVYVKDAKTPPAVAAVEVVLTSASPLTVKATVENQPGGNVNILATAAGGQTPYNYEADGHHSTTGLFTNLLANANYTVTARDYNHCEASITVWAGGEGENPQPTVTLRVIKQPLCTDSKAGEVEVLVSGGAAPYQYSTNNISWQETNILTGLGAGVHTVYVKEASGKVTITSVTLTASAALVLEVRSITAATSNTATDGAVYLHATGGQPAYNYSVDDFRYQLSPQIAGLKANTYTAYVLDASGCRASAPVLVGSGTSTTPPQLNMWAQVIGENTCVEKAKVAITVTNSTNVSYAKQDKVWGASNILTDFAAGTAWVYAKDNATNRIDSVQVTIKEATAIQALAYVSARLSSDAAADGEFTIYAIGGNAPYEYALANGNYQPNPIFSGLSKGTYTFRVKDAGGCTVTITGVMATVDIIVNPVTVEVTENEPPANYTVRLSDVPTASVGLIRDIAVSNMITATPEALTFEPAAWNRQLMTVEAINNTLTDGDRSNRVTHAVAASSDTRYAGIERHVLVTVHDDDYKDCERFLRSVKEGFFINGEAIRTREVTYCLSPEESLQTAISNKNGVLFEWNIAQKNGSQKVEKTENVLAATLAGTYTVTVTDSYGCTATSDALVLNIAAAPSEPIFYTGSGMSRPVPGREQEYKVIPEDVIYHWTFPSDWAVGLGVTNDTTSTISLLVGHETGNVCVTAADSLGVCPVAHSCLGVANFTQGEIDVVIYPTTLTDEDHTLHVVPKGFNVSAVMLVNKLGIQQTFDLKSEESSKSLIDDGKTARIIVNNMIAGHYFLIFTGTEGQKLSKLILKE